MRCKKGYKAQKTKFSTGKWLKRYFERRTCRKVEKLVRRWLSNEKMYRV